MRFVVFICVAILVLLVSWAIGSALARRRGDGWKLGLVIFLLIASLVPALVLGLPNFGPDLSPSRRLVFRIDASDESRVDVERTAAVAQSRAESAAPFGRAIAYPLGDDRIELILSGFGARDVAEAKRRLDSSGWLEFRVLADAQFDADVAQAALEPDSDANRFDQRVKWVQIGRGDAGMLSITPDGHTVVHPRDDGGTDILVLTDPYDVTGEYVAAARPGFRDGRVCVDFAMDQSGAKRLGALTQETVDRDRTTVRKHRIGIILDGAVLAAPTLNTVITEAGQITGDFTEQEVFFLVALLNSGTLPHPLTLQSEQLMSRRSDAQGLTMLVVAGACLLLNLIGIAVMFLRGPSGRAALLGTLLYALSIYAICQLTMSLLSYQQLLAAQLLLAVFVIACLVGHRRFKVRLTVGAVYVLTALAASIVSFVDLGTVRAPLERHYMMATWSTLFVGGLVGLFVFLFCLPVLEAALPAKPDAAKVTDAV